MKKKVLHVINSLKSGGAETLLANSLADGGLQDHIDNVLVYFQGTSALQDKVDKRVQIYDLQYKGLLSLPRTLWRLRKIIKKHGVEIVHSHLTPAGLYTHLICPVPQVHTLHTTYSADKENDPLKLYLEKQLFYKKRSCNIILLSDFIKEDFLRSVPFKGHSFVLNNFVPDTFFRKKNNNYNKTNHSLSLIAIGRLSDVKNFEYLLEVFTYLREYNIHLDIYGDGDMEKYEKIIAATAIKVKMKGHSSNLAETLQLYDLFVMSSKFEGFPLSLFEAMAAGVPTILSDIAPLKELAKDKALYFPLGDAGKAAESIIAVFKGEKDINTLAAKAQEYATGIARKEQYIDKLLDIYAEIGKNNTSKK